MSDTYYQPPCWPQSEQLLITPDDVGDIAALEELSERIFTDLDAAFTAGGGFELTYSALPGDHIYTALVAEQGLTFLLPGFRTFPADHVPALLADWAAPVICPVVIP